MCIRDRRFTEYLVKVTLHVPEGTDEHRAERMVTHSEHICLVTNSLTGETRLETTIVVDGGSGGES